MRHGALALSFALVLMATSTIARADEPLPVPETHEVKSRDGAFFARSVPGGSTSVYARGSTTALWSIPGWYRWLFVAPDGRSLVTCYDGMQLLQRDHRVTNTVMATFHSATEEKRTVTLGDLLILLGSMPKTVSHYRWGTCVGFDKAGRFEIDTVEKRRLYYDVRGKRVDARFDSSVNP